MSDSLLVREVQPYLVAHTDSANANLVWAQGARAGEYYASVGIPKNAELSALPTTTEIETECLEQLSILDQHEDSQWQPNPTYLLARNGLFSYLHRLYYGLQLPVGLRDAQLFSVHGEGEKYNQLLNAIDQAGLREYLQQLAESYQLKNVRIGKGSFSSSEQDYALYERIFSAGIVEDPGEKQRYFIHYTLSNTIPAVVQLGCLASDSYREAMGLTKESGESKRGDADFVDENEVCFWPRRVSTRGSNLDCTYGKTDFNIGFEYPVAWGVNVQNGTTLPVVTGDWCGEQSVPEKLDLVDVTNLWVAPFDVDRTTEILRNHNFGHIAVQPFINPLNQSRYREEW